MNRDRHIVMVMHGSRLYGMEGEKSDFDYKTIYLPAIESLILNTPAQITRDKTDTTEIENIPIQIFLDHFFQGQTYALEVAFALQQNSYIKSPHEGDPPINRWVNILIDEFLTRDISKMRDYALAQATKYGVKVERYESMKIIHDFITDEMGDQTLLESDMIDHMLKFNHVKKTMIENAKGGAELAPALDVCGKKFSYTTKWKKVKDSLGKNLIQYGERVKTGSFDGTDWKALAHAIRIIEQIEELCEHKKLTFPRPNSHFLKAIKEGLIPKDQAIAHLENKFRDAEKIINQSILINSTPDLIDGFKIFKTDLMRKYYRMF